jgi:hypothetical protein
MRTEGISNRVLFVFWLAVVACILYLWRIDTATAAPIPKPPEQTVQIKLRDLLDAIPRKTAEQILARLTAIEARLDKIEQKMPGGPVPIPSPEPLGKPR